MPIFHRKILSYEEVLKIMDNKIDYDLLRDKYKYIKASLYDLIISLNNKNNIF